MGVSPGRRTDESDEVARDDSDEVLESILWRVLNSAENFKASCSFPRQIGIILAPKDSVVERTPRVLDLCNWRGQHLED